MYFNMFLTPLLSLLLLLLLVAVCSAQEEPLKDIEVGMQGLMQAANDPALLAQLVRDMQVRI